MLGSGHYRKRRTAGATKNGHSCRSGPIVLITRTAKVALPVHGGAALAVAAPRRLAAAQRASDTP